MNLAISVHEFRISLSPDRARRFAVAILVVLLAAGCKERLYDFGGTLKPFDASAAGVPGTVFSDALPLPDSGPGIDVAGTDASGGASGHAGGGTGGSVQLCDPSSPDRTTDPFNCGTCLNNCTAPNSLPTCANGVCKISCIGDFVDADKNAKNGCECEPSNGGVEICDGLDNNCNGMVDEGFDFQNDVNDCGGCNKRCSYPFANASCSMGVCKQGA